MDAATRKALHLLDEVERTVSQCEPVQLDGDYLGLVAAAEALPENQDGADKSWLWERYSTYRDHFAVAEPEAAWIHSRSSPPR